MTHLHTRRTLGLTALSLALSLVACRPQDSEGTDAGLDAGDTPMMHDDAGMTESDAGIPKSELPSPRAVPPTDEAIMGAQTLREQIPGAAVHFSLRTGQIARVDAVGLSGVEEPGLFPGKPLVEARPAGEEGELSSMMEFMLRFGSIWGVEDPLHDLQVPRDRINDQLALPQENFSNGDLPSITGLRVRRLVQTFQGVPVSGAEFVGHFDKVGGLQSVSIRWAKIAPSFIAVPTFSARDLWETKFPQSLKTAAIQRSPALAWLSNATSAPVPFEHAEELVVDLITPDGIIDSADPAAVPRLTYRLHLRLSGPQALLIVDAQTGTLIQALDALPSTWANEGALQVAGANDETGTKYTLFLNTLFDSQRYLAATVNGEIPSWLDFGNFVAISDTTGRANLALTYFDPMKIPTAVNGVDNYWYNDANYTGGKRQAGPLMASITSTFDYWSTRRSWRGWDGQGASFWASIFNDKNGTATTELNAWGGNGIIQIGDGTTTTGQYCGSSKEVMGHELTHNVITATTKLEYLNESGAVNEALADFFGVAMTANRAANDYGSDYIGDDIGWSLRNMVDPPDRSQPDTYANYVNAPATSDSGGVHTNSGIINKAHSLLVKGGRFGLINVPRVGLERVEQILWASMRFKSYGEKATMQEFANGVLSICQVTDGINRIFGDTSYTATCAAFRRAYRAVGVLPWLFSDLELKATHVKAGILSAVVANNAGKSLTDFSTHASFRVTEKGTGSSFTLSPQTVQSDLDLQPTNELDVGAHARVTLVLPPELTTPPTDKRAFDVELLVDGVNASVGSAFRHAPAELTSDLTPGRVTLTPPVGVEVNVKGDIDNLLGTGFPQGVEGRLLARYGARAPFAVFDGLSGQSALPAVQTGAGPVRLIDVTTSPNSQYNFANGLNPIEVPSATPVVGRPGVYQVWFDEQGGLPELNDHFQVYFLIDSTNLADEADETNNLLCVNCRAPGQARGSMGVIVRLPRGTDVATLFPTETQAAALKLPAAYARILSVASQSQTRLPYLMGLK